MSENNPNGVDIGDTVYVEQAWEDETGNYHDEYARVVSIDPSGSMRLDFGRKDLNEFLDGCTWDAADYIAVVI